MYTKSATQAFTLVTWSREANLDGDETSTKIHVLPTSLTIDELRQGGHKLLCGKTVPRTSIRRDFSRTWNVRIVQGFYKLPCKAC